MVKFSTSAHTTVTKHPFDKTGGNTNDHNRRKN